MKTKLALAALSLALVGLGGCATVMQPVVPPEVQDALAKNGLSEQDMGIVAYPLHAPGRVLRLNAERPMQPASTMKLLTAIVSLDKLGPNARGRTELLADLGTLKDGVLPGPLVLRGLGDTDLDWGALWTLLREARERHGIREVQGGLIVDRTLFRPARLDIGVPPFDDAPEFPYNTIPDALQLNASELSFTLKSGASGAVQAATTPAWAGLEIDTSAMTLDEQACKDWEKNWKVPQTTPAAPAKVVLTGAFPRNCQQVQAFNIVDRQWLAATAVRQIWRELGGSMAGSAATDREAAAPAGTTVLATHFSRPLAEMLRGMMKRSDNPLTRQTFLRIGAAAATPEEPTLAAADRAVREWFAAKGIDATGLVLENGSGLSRLERIKPVQLAALLQTAWDGRQAAELIGTLPVAGYDGTLSRRMKGTPAEGRARMKTGTLHDTVALAGYVPDAQNRPWIVVGMVNVEKAARGRAALDALAAWVAKQP